MILDKIELAIKEALITAGYDGTIRTFWNDDETGEDEELKELPVISIVASPATYENNLKSFKMIPVQVSVITHTADDKKRSTLKAMYAILSQVIDDNNLQSDDVSIKTILNNEGGTSFIEDREQGVTLNLTIRVSDC